MEKVIQDFEIMKGIHCIWFLIFRTVFKVSYFSYI